MDKPLLYSLTNTQREVLLDEIYSNAPNRSLLTLIAFRVFISQNCNFAALEETWNVLLQKNDALRLRIRGRKARKQYISEYERVSVPIKKVDGRDGFTKLEEKLGQMPVTLKSDMPLNEALIVDCGDGSGGIIVRMHHLCCDGYSLEVLFAQIEKCYGAITAGETPKIIGRSISDYLSSQEQYFKSDFYKSDYAWWKQFYRKQKRISFPAGRPSLNGSIKEKVVSIDDEHYKLLVDFCTKYRCTIPSIIMTAAALTTRILTKKNNFSIHMLTHGRTAYPLRQTVGCLVRTVPVFFNYGEDKCFADYVKEDCKNYLNSMRHCAIPYKDHFVLSYWLSVKAGFNFFHNWLNISPMGLGEFSGNSEFSLSALPKTILSNLFYCAVLDNPKAERVDIKLIWQIKRYSEQQVSIMLNKFLKVLYSGIEEPNKVIFLEDR